MQFDRLEHIHRLIYAMSAPVPPGFCPVTVTQIVRADKELFTIMAREYPPPFKARADGSKPLNEALRSLMLDSPCASLAAALAGRSWTQATKSHGC